jgi:methylenetetrahydrofolate dehydrogenase (NADP+)/methenyltetrahydrofolate cyclohydrolase
MISQRKNKNMQIIDGKAIAQKIRERLKEKIVASQIKPGLAVILVGDDPASHLYISLKEKACQEVGIVFEKYLFPANEKEEKILEKISELNSRSDIHGILVQLPLPFHLDENKIIQAINPLKDVDGFHPENLKLFFANKPRVIPVIAKAIINIFETLHLEIRGKYALILANSDIFASTIKKILEVYGTRGETIIYDPNIPISQYPHFSQVDILITALGKPKLITDFFVKDGAIVIDIGITRLNLGTEEKPLWKTVGDVDYESLKEKPGWITPVPGGVGPITVACLLENVCELAGLE